MTAKEYAQKQGCKVYNVKGRVVVSLKKKRVSQDFNTFNDTIVSIAKRLKKAFEEEGYTEEDNYTTRRFSFPEPNVTKIRLKFERVE